MKAINKKALEGMKERLGDIRVSIDEIIQDETERFDSRSERWQESDNGQQAQAALDTLADIATSLEDIEDNLEDLLGEE